MVHSILRVKQRRQLMQTESLPPNQQYIPFGGQRLCALKGSRPIMNRAGRLRSLTHTENWFVPLILCPYKPLSHLNVTVFFTSMEKSKNLFLYLCLFFSTVSAPSRTLGRRKMIHNRFTIDTDFIVFSDGPSRDLSPVTPTDSPPSKMSSSAQQPIGDTDRWVEDQFDLQNYENQDDVKETDILSDDDEYCKSVRGPSSEPSLEESLEALSVEGDDEKQDDKGLDGIPEDKPSPKSHAPLKLTLLRKQCAVESVASERDCEVVWVRRDDFSNGCNSDIFWACERRFVFIDVRSNRWERIPTESKLLWTRCTDNPAERFETF